MGRSALEEPGQSPSHQGGQVETTHPTPPEGERVGGEGQGGEKVPFLAQRRASRELGGCWEEGVGWVGSVELRDGGTRASSGV